jgi:hypothetical protein
MLTYVNYCYLHSGLLTCLLLTRVTLCFFGRLKHLSSDASPTPFLGVGNQQVPPTANPHRGRRFTRPHASKSSGPTAGFARDVCLPSCPLLTRSGSG